MIKTHKSFAKLLVNLNLIIFLNLPSEKTRWYTLQRRLEKRQQIIIDDGCVTRFSSTSSETGRINGSLPSNALQGKSVPQNWIARHLPSIIKSTTVTISPGPAEAESKVDVDTAKANGWQAESGSQSQVDR